jgi:signal transduction histidine kinase
MAVFSIADSGCGMSEEYLRKRLFTPFQSTKKGGWGIGLYQTKEVVENQYGEILVESVEGHGTTFTVKLPLRADIESPSLESVR